MVDRLDSIDKRILYHLSREARHVASPEIAEEVSVSDATIRNRIQRLEEEGIIRGYHANVDYEYADGMLTNLYFCSAPVTERDAVASRIRRIPGVVQVRTLMSGRENLHVKAVGEDMAALNSISSAIASLGIDVEDEHLIESEVHGTNPPFAPEDEHESPAVTDLRSLGGEAKVFDLTVADDAPIGEMTLKEADEAGLLDAETLVIAVERDGTVITPKGGTRIEPDDLVTVFCPTGDRQSLTQVFTQPAQAES